MDDTQPLEPEALAANIYSDNRTDLERDLDDLILQITQGKILSKDVLDDRIGQLAGKHTMVFEHVRADLSQRLQQKYYSTAALTATAMNSISPEIQDMLFLHDPHG